MNISLKQGYDMFIFDRETYCKEKTIQNYKNTLSYFFKFMEQDRGCSISEIPLDSVSTMDVKKYVVSLRSKNKLEDHPFKPTVDHPITKRSIKTYSVDVRTFFHFLYDNEYIEKDIMKGFKIIKPEKKLVLPLFQGEVDMIDHLFNQKTYRGLRNYCIVHLMIDEGLRSGDIVNLTTRSVNFDENYVIVLDGKGDKDRIVPLALAGVVILTIGAGRNNEDKKVHLNFLDRCYTEIVAVVVFMIWLMGTSVIVQAMDGEEMRMAWKAIGFGTLGLWFGIWFLAGWLSLVRRIKARSLWRDSLLRHILLLVRKCFSKCSDLLVFLGGNMISRVKIILLFGIFIFLQFMFTGMTVEGGSALSLLLMIVMDCAVLYYLIKKAWGREQIIAGLKKITDGDLQYKIPTEKLSGEQEMVADYINHIGEGLDAAVENSLKNERMKTELITNVSHDIKTPLTSIINYVDLLKRENPEDPKIRGYLEVLENKAQRLKVLTEDVVEASKASTGNIALEMTDLNFIELVHQVIGEFEEKFEERNLKMVVHFDEEEAIICADGRRLWRVLENVFGNVSKYAMENTRVYVDVKVDRPNVQLSLKNISAQPLNISADELTERFIRGDVSRNTEGSGLGLSIAKDLVQLQGGEFRLYLDGDLFKVTIEFKMK